jgi:hypothetical protein
LFDKHLGKISAASVSKFGSLENVTRFLESLCQRGNLALAAREANPVLPMQLPRIIRSDRHLRKCIDLALASSLEAAEGVLYDRAINGYEELTYNKDGECIARKKKYCSKSLLEYLKANSDKYQSTKRDKGQASCKRSHGKIGVNTDVPAPDSISFEVESYGSDSKEQ